MKKTITIISCTHNKHKQLNLDLIESDIVIHAGDISSVGRQHEVHNFLKWFSGIPAKHKIFIAGNHDWLFAWSTKDQIKDILQLYPSVTYLQDESIIIDGLKFYGSPWQPEFNNWAFNLPRNGKELEEVWNKIPLDTDILITHGPPYGILDTTGLDWNIGNLGCKKLLQRVHKVKPVIHCFGHIHGGHGTSQLHNQGIDTEFINGSVLGEDYQYKNIPIVFEFDTIANKIIKFIQP